MDMLDDLRNELSSIRRNLESLVRQIETVRSIDVLLDDDTVMVMSKQSIIPDSNGVMREIDSFSSSQPGSGVYDSIPLRKIVGLHFDK